MTQQMIGDRTGVIEQRVIGEDRIGSRCHVTLPTRDRVPGTIRWVNHLYVGVQLDGMLVAKGALPEMVDFGPEETR